MVPTANAYRLVSSTSLPMSENSSIYRVIQEIESTSTQESLIRSVNLKKNAAAIREDRGGESNRVASQRMTVRPGEFSELVQ